MEFSLRQLRYLVAAAESGGVTAAGGALNVSQPAISAALAHLESYLGGPLFLRRPGRGLKPTPLGHRAIEVARRVLSEAATFEPGRLMGDGAVSGSLRLSCYGDLAPFFLPGLLGAYRARFPGVVVTLREDDFEGVVEDLREGRAELALSYRLGLSTEIAYDILAEVPIYALLPSGHFLAAAASVSLAELAEEPLILTKVPHSAEHFMELFRSRGLTPKQGIMTGGFETLRGLVARGFGVSLSYSRPKIDVAQDGAALVCRPLRDPVPPQPLVLLRHAGLALSGPAEAFRKLAIDRLAAAPS